MRDTLGRELTVGDRVLAPVSEQGGSIRLRFGRVSAIDMFHREVTVEDTLDITTLDGEMKELLREHKFILEFPGQSLMLITD